MPQNQGAFVQAVSALRPLRIGAAPFSYSGGLSRRADFPVSGTVQVPQSDAASGRIVIPCADSGVLLYPVIVGNAGDVAQIQVSLLRPIQAGSNLAEYPSQWFADVIFSATVRASGATGVAGGPAPATWRYCDLISSITDRSLAPPGVRIGQTGTADNLPASIAVDHWGASFVEVQMTQAGGQPVTCLYATYSG